MVGHGTRGNAQLCIRGKRADMAVAVIEVVRDSLVVTFVVARNDAPVQEHTNDVRVRRGGKVLVVARAKEGVVVKGLGVAAARVEKHGVGDLVIGTRFLELCLAHDQV